MPRKSTHEVKASLILSESVSRGSLFHVIASTKLEKPKNLVLAGYGCSKCGTEFAALKGSEPFCVVCNADSDYVEELEDDVAIEEVDDSELASVCCGSCNTNNIISIEGAKIFDTKIGCVTCGSDVMYELDLDEDEEIAEVGIEEEEDEEIADMEEEEIIIVDENKSTDGGNESTGKEIVFPENQEQAATEEKIDPTETPENNNTDDDDVHENPPIEDTPVNQDNNGVMPDHPEFPADNDNENPETGVNEENNLEEADINENEEFSDDTDDDDVELEEVDLLENVAGVLSFNRQGDKIVAFKGGIPVASLDKENAGENKGHFFASTFPKAIASLVKQQGHSVLASLGFETIKVSVPLKTVLDRKITAKVETEKAKFEEKAKTFKEDMQHCLTLAIAGLNKGFFKGKTNVLKTAFVNELAAAGIRNPAKIVDKVFAGFSEEFSQVLLDKAFELSKKSLETRNELAEAIGDSEFVMELDDEDEMENDTVTVARLSRGAKPKTKEVSSTVALATSSISEGAEYIRNITGGSLFLRK